MTYVIDASNAIVGRIATVAAKRALLGDEVAIVNCESAILSGTKQSLRKKWQERLDLGQPQRGPYIPRMPDRFIRRVIRGMLGYKDERGRSAHARVKCYLGVPQELKEKKFTRIEDADLKNLKGTKFMKLSELCKLIGGKQD